MTRGIRLPNGDFVPWEETGAYQLDFLKSQKMEPFHYLLDIGCSALRGGIHFIKYLDESHYYGFDKEEELIGFAKSKITRKYHLSPKDPHLYAVKDFDLDFLKIKFDYIFAQSVFSHSTPDGIRLCLDRIRPLLFSKGRFYATYHEGRSFMLGESHTWREIGDERIRVEYPFSYFEGFAREFGLKVISLGNWAHEHWSKGDPDNAEAQKMLLFQSGC